jgi:hypothetical protein
MSKPRKTPASGQTPPQPDRHHLRPGAMLDLPRHSVIVGGLEHWTEHGRHPHPRAPPRGQHRRRSASRAAASADVHTAGRRRRPRRPARRHHLLRLPRVVHRPGRGRTHHRPPGPDLPHPPARALARPRRRRSTISTSGKKIAVVPVRFVQACRNGHISDIDWHRFTHGGQRPPRAACGSTRAAPAATSATSTSAARPPAPGARSRDAKLPESRVLGRCSGDRPWLGRGAREDCKARTATSPSGAACSCAPPATPTSPRCCASSRCPRPTRLRKAVDALWDDELAFVDDLDDLVRLRRKNKPKITEQTRALPRRRDLGRDPAPPRRLRRGQADQAGRARDPPRLPAREPPTRSTAPTTRLLRPRRELPQLPPILAGRLERVVLVHRLREVVAQIGFTRFEAAVPTSTASSASTSAAPPSRASPAGSPPSRTAARACSSGFEQRRHRRLAGQPGVQGAASSSATASTPGPARAASTSCASRACPTSCCTRSPTC